MVGTVEAIQRELVADGLVMRYQTHGSVDGLPGKEGTFLPCSFWLVDNLALMGRLDEARELFERLLGLCKRRGPGRRGVRRPPRPPGRQLPPGVQSRRSGQQRPEPGRGVGGGGKRGWGRHLRRWSEQARPLAGQGPVSTPDRSGQIRP